MGLVSALLLGLSIAAHAEPCDPNLQRQVVVGDSMVGRANAGDVVVVDTRPTDCWHVEAGDWVVWRPTGRKRPVIKVVRAVGGDRLDLVRLDDGHHLWVNDVELHTASGAPFAFTGGRSRLLRQFQGVVPTGALLLLGEVPSGSDDSSRYGLVHHSALIGRVVAVEPLGTAVIPAVPSPPFGARP